VETHHGVLTIGGTVTASVADTPSTIEGTLSLGGQTRTFHMEGGPGGAPNLRVLAAISNGSGPAGIIKTGTKALALAGPNTYTGLTTINQGSIYAEHTQAFGSAAFGTVVQPQSYIVLMTDIPNEPLTGVNSYPGALMLQCIDAATRVWGGPIALTGENAVAADTPCTLRLNGVIAGGGAFRTVSGHLELSAHNTYAGATTLASDVRLLGSEVLPDGSPITLHNTLDLNGHVETVSSIAAGAPTAEIIMGGGTLQVAAAADSTYAGKISGTGTLTKSGNAVWTLSGVSTFSGGANILAGRTVVSGVLPAAITLNGGTIAGAGTVGAIAGPAGTIVPGNAIGAPGLLNSASVTMNPAMTMALVLNGSASGTQHSQLRVTGGVTLNGAVLEITAASGGAAAVGTTPLTIVDNDGPDPIVGFFANLPEGATFTAQGVQWRISYVGGTGNDITLRAVSAAYYLSEGATGPFFNTDLLIANPNTDATNAELRLLKEDGTTVTMTLTIAALSRTTIRVDNLAGLEATTFSTVVTSTDGLPLIVERTMSWDASGYGAHTEKASSGPALTWYFAEGAAGHFHTYLLLSNPQDATNNVTVTYLLENQAAVTRFYQLLPHARRTIDTSEDPELLNRSFGMTVAFEHAGMAERAMYFGNAPLFTGGHASAGVTAPATSWFLAEGATGPFFETFILIANPGAQPVDATVTYLPNTGVPVVKSHTIGAGERLTLDVELEHESLANVAVATKVTAPAPLVVERSQYWPFTPDQWFEAHNSAGVTELGLKWGLAEGRVGGQAQYQTYILLANPGDVEASVQIQFLRESAAPIVKSFVVGPTSRVNVQVGPGADVPELANESFGAIITSTQPIAVERAMYADVNGQTWGAGTNATATRLP
jgi:autotransporter-associated beta strand protein